jgi:hypothetical protein
MRLAVFSLLFGASGLAAAQPAGELGLVTTLNAPLRPKADVEAPPIAKLNVGQFIRVDDHHKKKWVHATVVNTSPGAEPLVGWIELKHVNARSRYGFWFERRDKDGKPLPAPKKVAPAPVEAPPAEPAPAETTEPSSDSVDPVAEDEGWESDDGAASEGDDWEEDADDLWGDTGDE